MRRFFDYDYDSVSSVYGFNDQRGESNLLVDFEIYLPSSFELSKPLIPLFMETDDYSADTSTTGVVVRNGDEVSVSGSFDFETDEDWFAITLDEGEIFEIQWDPGYMTFEIYDDLGNVYDGPRVSAPTPDDYASGLIAPYSGTFYVAYRHYWGDLGPYNFSGFVYTDDYANDETTTSEIVVDASPLQGALQGYTDEDWFTIQLTAGDTVTIDTDIVGGLAHSLRLIDEDGEILEYSNYRHPIATITHDVAVSGTYYVELEYDFQGQAQSEYNIFAYTEDQLEDIPANATTTATISAGQTVSSEINRHIDIDWFRFTAEANEAFIFEVTPDLVLRVGNQSATNSGLDSNSVSYVTPEAGEYYIIVTGIFDGRPTYDLTMTQLDDDYSADTSTTAVIGLDESYSVDVDFEGDIDWIKLSANQGDVVRLTTARSVNDVALIDAEGNELADFYVNYTTSERAVDFKIPDDGDYYIRVERYYFSYEDYVPNETVTVTTQSISDDFGDSAATATTLNIGETIDFEHDFVGDQDWISFDVEAGQTVLFYAFSPNYEPGDGFQYGTNFNVYNVAGDNILSFDRPSNYNGGEIADITFQFTESGTYYLSSAVYSTNLTQANRLETAFVTVNGTPNADILNGSAIDDFIYAQAGNDRLIGNDGDDSLVGRAGADTLIGGAGADIHDGGADFDTVDYRGATSRVGFNVESGGTIGEALGDSYIAIERYYASNFNDVITGSDANEFFYGEDGNDQINGGGGIDRIYGGQGDDIQRGQAGNDTLYGSAGADQLNGGTGTDVANYSLATEAVELNLATGGISGDATGDTYFGIEAVYGSNFDDALTGSSANNDLRGGMGDDVLNGESGNDRLYGGTGADTLNGGAGLDAAYYATAASGVSLDLTSGGTVGEAMGDLYNSIEWVFGSAHADEIVGDDSANRLWGGNGDDMLNGAGGNDRLLGGNGEDMIYGGDGVDTLFGEEGDDTMFGGNGNDFFFGGAGADSHDGGVGIDTVSYLNSVTQIVLYLEYPNSSSGDARGDSFTSIERIFATNFDDSLFGGENTSEAFFGFGGNDVLWGGLGASSDSLFGGSGNDYFYYGLEQGADIIFDFQAGDTADELINFYNFEGLYDTFDKIMAIASQVGNNVIFDFGVGNSLTLVNVDISDLNAGDFVGLVGQQPLGQTDLYLDLENPVSISSDAFSGGPVDLLGADALI